MALFGIARDELEGELYEALARAGLADIRPGHGCVFGNITREGERLTAIAERARMTKQAVGEVASDLERLGYLERLPDPSDRRAKILRLTDKGLMAQTRAYEILAELERRWEERFGSARVATVRAVLVELHEELLESFKRAAERAA
jgi:DNA-binding MarR family transcriptional regulator